MDSNSVQTTSRPLSVRGLWFGAGAYLLWGVIPLYFKAVEKVHILEVVCHRVFWTVVLLTAFLLAKNQFGQALALLKNRAVALRLFITMLLIASNWLIYIYAIHIHELSQASLGYFFNPLVSVVLGAVVLKERLRPFQWVGFALACTGVLWEFAMLKSLPWIPLSLAGTFALYGLMRKTTPEAGPFIGLWVETLFALPFALMAFAWLGGRSLLTFPAGDISIRFLLLCAGPVTAVPLMLFAAAAQRIPLSMLGFLQYLAPTQKLLIAVFIFSEPMDLHKLTAFIWVWAGLAVFLFDAVRHLKLKPA